MLAFAALASHLVADAGRTSVRNLDRRYEVLDGSRKVKDAIWDTKTTLDTFLLNPDPQLQERIHRDMKRATTALHRLDQVPDLAGAAHHALTAQLLEDLRRLQAEMDRVMAIRTDGLAQYPSLELIHSRMKPAHVAFTHLLENLLAQLGDSRQSAAAGHMARTLQDNWLRMTGEFRLYLAARFAAVSDPDPRSSATDVRQIHQRIDEQIAALRGMAASGQLNVLPGNLVEQLQGKSDAWFDAFEKIVELDRKGLWRADLPLLANSIHPLFDRIWAGLRTLDQTHEHAATTDVDSLARLAGGLSQAFWILSGVGLALIALAWFFFNRMVLAPISLVAGALRGRRDQDHQALRAAATTRETRELVLAFRRMQRQVSARQRELEHQALHDALTGLPNRSLLKDRVDHAILTAKRNKRPFALIVKDLDRFKEINDTLGHHAGDAVLVTVSERLLASLRESDTVARLGGDEFAILLPSADAPQAAAIANKITRALEQEIVYREHKLYIGGSMGIALFPRDGDDSKRLFQHADVAMYQAKRNNRSFAFYDSAYDSNSLQSLQLVSDLRDAIQRNELLLHFQAKLDVLQHRVVGVEALLRWDHRSRGMVRPDEMVAVAEKTGLIRPLTLWVLGEAIAQAARWHQRGLELEVAVNLSVWNLLDPDLPGQVEGLLQKHQVPARLLTLEITEGAMMADPEHAERTLCCLDAMGVRLAVDDFGTGFSSLAYLKRLPVDELKIDRSFIMDMLDNDSDAVIVRSTVDLAHNLGMRVVAEGVESVEILDLLEILGCDTAQGYHIGRPMPAAELERHLAEKARLPSPDAGGRDVIL